MADKMGIILIDKPQGLSSAAVVSRLRLLLGTSKVGHCGTLDPFATGVLPVAFGRATKACSYMTNYDKTYLCKVHFGRATDTMDIDGDTTAVAKDFDFSRLSAKALTQMLKTMEGEQWQKPPMYSAVKVKGKPLYKYARQGQEVEVAPRHIKVFAAKLQSFNAGDPAKGVYPEAEVLFKVSKGTYIRVLADILGKKTEAMAYAAALDRVACGPFKKRDSLELDALFAFFNAHGRDSEILYKTLVSQGKILPVETALQSFPRLRVSYEQAVRLLQGQEIAFAEPSGINTHTEDFVAESGDMSKVQAAITKSADKPQTGELFQIFCADVFAGMGKFVANNTLKLQKAFVEPEVFLASGSATFGEPEVFPPRGSAPFVDSETFLSRGDATFVEPEIFPPRGSAPFVHPENFLSSGGVSFSSTTDRWPTYDNGTAVTFGDFDGVHRGHKLLLQTLFAHCQNLGNKAPAPQMFIITFCNHDTVDLITPLPERLLLLQSALPAASIITIDFAEVRNIEAETFLSDILQEKLHAKLVVVGGNARFGQRAAGDLALLQAHAARHNYQVLKAPYAQYDGERISSTLIRTALKKGEIKKANQMLGRPFSIRAKVRHGKGIAKNLGAATLNSLYPAELVHLQRGVYLSKACCNGKEYAAITNVGVAPTFGDNGEVLLETHLLAKTGDFYDQMSEIKFLDFMRAERKFPNVEALKAQISEDIHRAKVLHNTVLSMEL